MKNDKLTQHKLKKYDHEQNGWWILDYCELANSRFFVIDRSLYEHNHVDSKVCYCPVCKKVWESHPYLYDRNVEVEYFSLPSIGKKRKVCNNCK